MKNSFMRPPAISQIYNQKLSYENHLKKLVQIREDRKHQLQYDQTRQNHLANIKQVKSKSFAHKFNEHNLEINQSNVKFLVKLQHVKPFARYTSYSSSDKIAKQPTFLKPITKRKIIQTEKQNSRLYMKMKSVSSTLSKDRMMNDYVRAQRIKERISKYANDNNKIALKSEKYFNHNKSFISSRSSQNGSTERLRNNLVSHYKKEDIMKNRISNTEHRIFKQKRQNKPLPSLNSKEQEMQEDVSNYVEQKNDFFTTQPQKDKKRSLSTNKRIV